MKCEICNKRYTTRNVCDECINRLKTQETIAADGTYLHPNLYQSLAQRTAATVKSEDKILNGALGLAGESGEVADHVKKALFQSHELDTGELIEELGDILWYCAELAEGLGVGLETVMELNVEKLRGRYPDGFDGERSVNR